MLNNCAFVFPGQGSQSLKMMAEHAEQSPEILDYFRKAEEVLGYNLWDLIQNGPEQSLNQTEKTQPALLTCAVAAWDIWTKKSKAMPAWVAGHSLGEYAALVASQALRFEDAVLLVAKRGQFMQEAVPSGQGAMAAILGLDISTVESACIDAAHQDVVEPANINAPGQIVIAGDACAVERACKLLKGLGAKRAMTLPVSVPSHCALMQPAARKLEQLLATIDIKTPEIPLLHNVDVQSHQQPEAIRNALVSQLYKPVQWIATIEAMADKGVTDIVECGPGKVLSGLVKRINKQLKAHNLSTPEGFESTLSAINEVSYEV